MGNYKGIVFDDHLTTLLSDLINKLTIPKVNTQDILSYSKMKRLDQDETHPNEFKYWYSKILKRLNTKYKRTTFKNKLKDIPLYLAPISIGKRMKNGVLVDVTMNPEDLFFVESSGVHLIQGQKLDSREKMASYDNAIWEYTQVMKTYIKRYSK